MEENKLTEPTEKRTPLEKASRILSNVFTPFWIPTIAFVLLFFFTYLRIMPIGYKLVVFGLVFCFTVALPTLAIWVFQKIHGWGIRELSQRKRRFMPYLLAIVSYVAGLITMNNIHLPRYMSGIIMAALLAMVICTLTNLKWKISTHTAGGGLMVGGLLSYSLLFHFNPVWWLSFFILLSGALGSARIILKQHTLLEVFAGFLVGLFCGVIGILFI